MILSDVSIKRPVFATVISLLIVVFGVSALMKLPIREYPDIDPPEVSISVDYAGAAPEVIDTQIIQVIEGAISGVEGVRKIESRSRLGSARTTVEFTLERDVDIAANDVRDAVSRVLNRLPEEAETPVIAKADADARPIIWVTLTSSTLAPPADRFCRTVPGGSLCRARWGIGSDYRWRAPLCNARVAGSPEHGRQPGDGHRY